MTTPDSNDAQRWDRWAASVELPEGSTRTTRGVLHTLAYFRILGQTADVNAIAKLVGVTVRTTQKHLNLLVNAKLVKRAWQHRPQDHPFLVYDIAVSKCVYDTRYDEHDREKEAERAAAPAPTKPRIKRPPSVYHLVADRLDAANADPRLAEVPHDRKLQAIIGVILKHQEALGYQTQARELEQWFDEIVAKRG